jgi:hypothetical protein
MPISWSVERNGQVNVSFIADYSIEEAERVMKEVYADARPARPLRFLVDVRHSAPPDIEFIVSAVTFWQLHAKDMWDARVAVVTATARQEDMARMSAQSAAWRNLPFSVRSFHEPEWDEARRWLTHPSSA